MKLSNYYNFRNPIRHFVDIDSIIYPTDIETFDVIDELCWTKPISFKIFKANDKYRTIKLPNILNFARAYHYYKGLPDFDDTYKLDASHKRLKANLDTGDFVSGEYDKQLNNDFVNLCNYDYLIKFDISEYYGRIYTHYLDLDKNNLKDNALAWLNNGRTSGILMGNYISLYFAEYLSSVISKDIQVSIEAEGIDCTFNYFSDDFYFFCYKRDIERIKKIFDDSLEKKDFVRSEKSEIWTYETYNKHNILTRYWKATVRAWNEGVIKEEKRKSNNQNLIVPHKLSFINQLVYRVSELDDEKRKRSLIVNFFKTHHFQNCDFSKYDIRSFDYHQLFYLVKMAPESLLYIIHLFESISELKENELTKNFFKMRFKEALVESLHDNQIYYYYAISQLGFVDILKEYEKDVVGTANQILTSYYLKDGIFESEQLSTIKACTGEEFWFQSYHLILYSPEMKVNLDANIKKYLIPDRLKDHPNSQKEKRYIEFYKDNLSSNISFINDILTVENNIKDYLTLRFIETTTDSEE